MEKKDILAFMSEHEIVIDAVFVPWSKSRSFDPAKVKYPQDKSLNWKVTLRYRGKAVIETDYMAGIAHCPCYKKIRRLSGGGVSLYDAEFLEREVENGFPYRDMGGMPWLDKKNPILPEPDSVLYSLLLDGDAIDYFSFEDWASNYGYDTDSRKAEVMYRACIDIGLKLRNAFGEKLLTELRDIFQDY